MGREWSPAAGRPRALGRFPGCRLDRMQPCWVPPRKKGCLWPLHLLSPCCGLQSPGAVGAPCRSPAALHWSRAPPAAAPRAQAALRSGPDSPPASCAAPSAWCPPQRPAALPACSRTAAGRPQRVPRPRKLAASAPSPPPAPRRAVPQPQGMAGAEAPAAGALAPAHRRRQRPRRCRSLTVTPPPPPPRRLLLRGLAPRASQALGAGGRQHAHPRRRPAQAVGAAAAGGRRDAHRHASVRHHQRPGRRHQPGRRRARGAAPLGAAGSRGRPGGGLRRLHELRQRPHV